MERGEFILDEAASCSGVSKMTLYGSSKMVCYRPSRPALVHRMSFERRTLNCRRCGARSKAGVQSRMFRGKELWNINELGR